MELRVMEYFLAVAREQNISRAAESLHLTQPTLSRQLKALEDEIGKQLIVRGKRKVTLTEEGMFFRKRAEEIVSLAKRTEIEMRNSGQYITGEIYIGTGESDSVRNIIRVVNFIREENSGIHFHFTSGDASDLLDRLDNGLFDFCILFGDIDQSKYDYIALPYEEKWGVLMRKDAELSDKKIVETSDLHDKPLILSRHSMNLTGFFKWIGKSAEELDIVGTYNLVYTAALMADEGAGYVIALEKLVNTIGTNLCFKPLHPGNKLRLYVVWKKYQVQSKAAEKFIDALNGYLSCGK